jgi:GDP-4-dehydro-6-deoxy-D-mannose reductase
MEMMANQFAQNYGLRVVLPRLFIHVGPNHPPATALQAFAMQIAAIKLGKQSPIIKVGNLGSSRDFVDVRDGVRALQLIADEKFSGQTFNICTGRAWGIAQCLEMMIDIAKVEVEVVEDLGRMRPSDEALLVGNPERINALGWNAAIPFQKTLEDIFDNWVYRLQ